MAKVEVDEEALVPYQRAMALFNKMSGDPKAKRDLEKAIKAVEPSFRTSDEAALDVAGPYIEDLKATKKELDDLKKSLADERKAADERAADGDLESRLKRVRTAYNFTEEGMKRLTDTMIERKIANPEDAAKLLEFEKPKTPQGASFESSRWGLDDAKEQVNGRPSFADWVNNTEATVNKELSAAMNDIYAARERASGF